MDSSQPVTLVSDTIKIKRKRAMTVRGKLLEDAKRMAEAAEKKAIESDVPMVIAVCVMGGWQSKEEEKGILIGFRQTMTLLRRALWLCKPWFAFHCSG